MKVYLKFYKSIFPSLSIRSLFNYILTLQGRVYRDQDNRRTLEFTSNNKNYFLKVHHGMGWKKIFKNLIKSRLPIVDARPEWRAIQDLHRIGVKTMTVVAYGKYGVNPASRKSFLITEALTNTIILEDLCRSWNTQPPKFTFKKNLIIEIATIAQRLHEQGIYHGDFYIHHFLLDKDAAQQQLSHTPYLIDLHRVQQYKKLPLPLRIKDLVCLYSSTKIIKLTRRDLWRFMCHYTEQPLRHVLQPDPFWQTIQAKTQSRRQKNSNGLKLRPDIASISQHIDVPFSLHLKNSPSLLQVDTLIRVIKNVRMVVQGKWQEQAVIAKIYAGPKGKNKVARDHHGAETLLKLGIDTPQVFCTDEDASGQLNLILYQSIQNGKNLYDVWKQTAEQIIRADYLQRVITHFAKLHQHGFWHSDPHFGNYLLAADKIYLIDAESIQGAGLKPLEEKQSLNNLALLLSHLTNVDRHLIPHTLKQYLQLRGWDAEKQANLLQQLLEKISHHQQVKRKTYLRRIFKDCEAFAVWKLPQHYSVCDRQYLTMDFHHGLHDPEILFAKADKNIQIMRFKSWGYSSPAKRHWKKAHQQLWLGEPTVKPIAFIEKQRWYGQKVSYFIYESLGASELKKLEEIRQHPW